VRVKKPPSSTLTLGSQGEDTNILRPHVSAKVEKEFVKGQNQKRVGL